jgi:RNA polymerase sigma-70 factor (ECF subfamily)
MTDRWSHEVVHEPPIGAAEMTPSPNPRQTTEFERGVLPLRPELERVARRYTGNVHDAEDLVQETLAKAWSGYGSFDPGTNLRAWLFRIMVNTWISSHRRTQRRPKESLTDAFTDAQLAEDRYAVHPSAELEALQDLPDGRLRHAFAALPTSLALAVYYADVCQYAYKEIAEIQGIPVGTVMSRIHRARKQLRLALSDLAPAPRPVPGSVTAA